MAKGFKTSKSRIADCSDDKNVMKGVKYFCQGRGCRHTGKPELKPNAICFYIKGSSCSHKDVMSRIQDVLPLSPGATIHDIQFVPLAVHLDSLGTENRWIITLSSQEARNRLAGTTLHIRGQKVTLRRYDDIIQLEYRKCSKSSMIQTMVNKIKNLDNGIEKS